MADDNFREILDRFDQVALDYYDVASDVDKEKLAELLLEQFNIFTQQAKSAVRIASQPCPPGWTTCPDGSCVPPGVLCD